MFVRELVLSGLLVLGASTKVPVSTGNLRLTFTERSPLSAIDVVLQRMDYANSSVELRKSFEYDLAGLSFDVFVPRTYRADVPHGLFVWMGVTDAPPAWRNVLARHKLILIAANTRKGHAATYGPPLDAVLRVKVDGATVRTFDEPASAESTYVARTVDVSSFANGASHVIQFEYVNPGGSGKSNFVVDDLTIDCSASGT